MTDGFLHGQLGLSVIFAKSFPSQGVEFHINLCAMLNLPAQRGGGRTPDNQRICGSGIRSGAREASGERPTQPLARHGDRRIEVLLASQDVDFGETAESYLPQEGR